MNASPRSLVFILLLMLVLFGANVALMLFGPFLYRMLTGAVQAVSTWAWTAGLL